MGRVSFCVKPQDNAHIFYEDSFYRCLNNDKGGFSMYGQRQYSQDRETGRTNNLEVPQMSRQERLMAAKAAFGTGTDRHMGRNIDSAETENLQQTEGTVFRFGLIRFMASGMLLLVLLAAFATGFSYHGFDQNYVQERMNDETTWHRLEQKVQKLYIKAMAQYEEISGK